MKNFQNKIETIKCESHPILKSIRKQKNTQLLEFTMKEFGIVKELIVVENEGQYYVIDGSERLTIAKQFPELFPEIPCRVINIPDHMVIDQYILHNTVTKISIEQLCIQLEHVLGILGHQPGKKREILGLENVDLKGYGKIRGDKFDWACHMVGTDLSPSSVRRLMAVYYAEKALPKDKKTGVMKFLNSGEVSINKAYELLLDKKRKEEEANLIGKDYSSNCGYVSYQLFNKSSLCMDEIDDNSVRLFVDSHPYFQLRRYRNQGEAPHGRERTPKEYVEKFVLHCKEKMKKLVEGGVMVTILGETYRGGYQGICRMVEQGLVDNGWTILDVDTWVKTNPKSTPHPNRFLNAKESIIIAMKPGGKPVFNSTKKKSSSESFKVIRGTKRVNGSSGFSMTSTVSDEINVITSSGFNTSELKRIDSTFQHDAPASVSLYKRYIRAFSHPGDTICDGFVGSGSISIGLELGRNVIGYDIDPVSIEFSHKRCESCLKEIQNTQVAAAA